MDVVWLQQRIDSLGLVQKELAESVGMSEQMLSNVLNGRRALKASEADAIRRKLGYRLPEDRQPTIPVIARVSAGDGILAISDHENGDGLFHIKRPDWIPDSGVGAAVVEGSSAEPFALPGDIIFWCRETEGVMRRDIGRPVIAQLADGRAMLKRLAEGSKRGLWNLFSINPAFPGHTDVELAWASRVFAPLSREDMEEVVG